MSEPQESPTDVLVIGAGPTGLACAIEAQRAGFRVVLVDKGCLTNSLFHYPAHMTFFTTPELLEIGNMPFSSPNQKPTRSERARWFPSAGLSGRVAVDELSLVEDRADRELRGKARAQA